MKNRLLYIIVCLYCFAPLQAQQQSLYSQYMMNGFLFNPAVAGSDGYTTLNLTAREQWIGFENAPKTRSISIQGRLNKSKYKIKSGRDGKRSFNQGRSGRVGLGGIIYNDKNGLIDKTGMQGTYAYHIFINNSQLSFGISGSVFQFEINEEGLQFKDPDDPLNVSDLKKPVYVPDAGAGIYYANSKYYVGASVSQLFQSPLKIGNRVLDDFKMYRHYYFIGGYNFPVMENLDMEPSILFQYTDQLITQTDISLKFYYNDSYWFGSSFRTSGAVILLGGIRLDKFYLGYSFDYTFSNIRKHSYGSHEIMLFLKMGDNVRRYRWLRRY